MPPTFADDDDRIAWFFDSPTRPPAEHARAGSFSVLYLLRRELIETMGYDPNVDDESAVDAGGSQRRLFASLILMFTVVDLLAKFALPSSGPIGERFRAFLESPDGGQIGEFEARLFWAIRNSLVHAFGVPESGRLTDIGLVSVQIAQRKEMSPSGMRGLVGVELTPAGAGIIYVDGVFRTAIGSISRYQSSLYGAEAGATRPSFLTAFELHGMIEVSHV